MLIGFTARVGCGSHGASMVLSMVFGCCGLFLKCRWFFGRVFSFPLVEEFV